MCLSLLRFDFVSAFHYQPVILIAGIFWVLVSILLFWGKWEWPKNPKFLYTSFALSISSMLIFCVLRNIY
jgi:hypothetical protein